MSSFFQQLIKHDMIYIKARISNESGFVWFRRLRGVRSVENEECVYSLNECFTIS